MDGITLKVHLRQQLIYIRTFTTMIKQSKMGLMAHSHCMGLVPGQVQGIGQA